jgi:hypothetical protein
MNVTNLLMVERCGGWQKGRNDDVEKKKEVGQSDSRSGQLQELMRHSK